MTQRGLRWGFIQEDNSLLNLYTVLAKILLNIFKSCKLYMITPFVQIQTPLPLSPQAYSPLMRQFLLVHTDLFLFSFGRTAWHAGS